MRTAEAIDADIASTEATLRALHDERRAASRSKNAAIVAEFLAAKPVKAIAADRDTTVAAIFCVLRRAGHSVKGRRKLREQLEHQAIVDRHATRSADAPQVERQSVGSP